MPKRVPDTFPQREISAAINNAVIRSLAPARLGPIPDEKLRRLREYATAVVKPCSEHLEENLLQPEELVAVLLCCALFIQMRFVTKNEKLPAALRARLTMEDTETHDQ